MPKFLTLHNLLTVWVWFIVKMTFFPRLIQNFCWRAFTELLCKLLYFQPFLERWRSLGSEVFQVRWQIPSAGPDTAGSDWYQQRAENAAATIQVASAVNHQKLLANIGLWYRVWDILKKSMKKYQNCTWTTEYGLLGILYWIFYHGIYLNNFTGKELLFDCGNSSEAESFYLNICVCYYILKNYSSCWPITSEKIHVVWPKFLEYPHCWANPFLLSLFTFCLLCSLDYWTIPCSWSTATHQSALGFSAYFLQMCFSSSLMCFSLANFFRLPSAWRTADLSSYPGEVTGWLPF